MDSAERPTVERWSRARQWARWRTGLLVAALVAGGVLLPRYLDLGAVHAAAQRLNGIAAFALLVILPLFGFPASVLHVAAGIRFGATRGLLLVSLSIGLQLVISYALVHAFRAHFARRFEGWRRRIPPGAHASICVFAVLIPGAPFAAVNYVLPLLGVRWRTYLLCCWPLDTVRATVTVLLGDQADKFTPMRLVVLAGYALLLSGCSWWLYRRLRRQLANPRPAEDGRMQPA